MMALIRLYPKTDSERLWSSVLAELEGYRSRDVTPFYASQSDQDFVTVSLNAKDPNSLMDFTNQKISGMDDLADTHTIPLVKPLFLPLLKDMPTTMGRYTIELKAHPKNYSGIYESLIEKRYGRDLVLAYIAYKFGEYDLFLSLLATNQEKVKDFADTLTKTKNVLETKTTAIKKTLLLARDDWDRFRLMLLYRPSWFKGETESLYDINLSITQYGAPF